MARPVRQHDRDAGSVEYGHPFLNPPACINNASRGILIYTPTHRVHPIDLIDIFIDERRCQLKKIVTKKSKIETKVQDSYII